MLSSDQSEMSPCDSKFPTIDVYTVDHDKVRLDLYDGFIESGATSRAAVTATFFDFRLQLL